MARSIEQLIEFCALNGLGGQMACKGCTSTEIELLEHRHKVMLPKSYREFLSRMGHDACRLFAHDHTVVSYNEAITLPDELPERIAEERRFRDDDFNFTVQLPDDAILIGSRLGDWHWFVRCNETEDCAVWAFGITGQNEIRKEDDSFIEWLFGWATEAKLVLKPRDAE